jgi:hypothetical protein
MVAGSTASAKDKARIHQQAIAKDIQEAFDLSPVDVVSVPMGSPGIDIMLSEHARSVFPFGIEAKRVEKLSIPKWWRQTKINAKNEGLKPMLIFRQNYDEELVIMRWSDFVELVKL